MVEKRSEKTRNTVKLFARVDEDFGEVLKHLSESDRVPLDIMLGDCVKLGYDRLLFYRGIPEIE